MKTITVAVISDFQNDYYHAVMKAVILKHAPKNIHIQFVDVHINHQYNITATAWAIKNTYKYFPADTIFLAVIDPGVGTKRKPLLIKANNQYFIGPDNGIFSAIIQESYQWKAFEIKTENIRQYQESQSNTFHGRDIFAPATTKIIHLITKKQQPNEETIGPEITKVVTINVMTVKVGEKGKIVYIDTFGNIVTNVIPKENIKKYLVKISQEKALRLNHYENFQQAKNNETFLITGSCNTLEIVKTEQPASKWYPDLKINTEIIISPIK